MASRRGSESRATDHGRGIRAGVMGWRISMTHVRALVPPPHYSRWQVRWFARTQGFSAATTSSLPDSSWTPTQYAISTTTAMSTGALS